jgi:hypothetical protein
MKANIKIFAGAAAALLALFAFPGCATLAGAGSALGNEEVTGLETTIFYPDKSLVWAGELTAASPLSNTYMYQASQYYREQATYQTTARVAGWEQAGWDFEYTDKIALNREIQAGNYRLGAVINNVGRTPGNAGVRANSAASVRDEFTVKDPRGKVIGTVEGPPYTRVLSNDPIDWGHDYLIDPDKPRTYRPVFIKTVTNQTVNAVDEKQFSANYRALVKEKQDWIIFNYLDDSGFREVTDTDTFNFTGAGAVSGKKVKAILADQLKYLPPGTVLVNGGINDNPGYCFILKAQTAGGVLKCQVYQYQ